MEPLLASLRTLGFLPGFRQLPLLPNHAARNLWAAAVPKLKRFCSLDTQRAAPARQARTSCPRSPPRPGS